MHSRTANIFRRVGTPALAQSRRFLIAALMTAVALVGMSPAGLGDSFEEKIDGLESKAAQNAAAQKSAAARLESAREKRRLLESDIANATERRAQAKAHLATIAIEAYKTGGDTYLSAVFTDATDTADVVARQGYMNRLMRETRRHGNEARDAADDAEAALGELRDVEAEEQSQLAALHNAESSIESALAEQRRLYEESKKPPPPPPAPAAPEPSASTSTSAKSASGSAGSGSSSNSSGGSSSSSPAPAPTTSDGISAHLARIKVCESGGNYSLVSSSGTYTGAYQFSDSTWAAVGGSGRAKDASPAEQDMRARMLYERSGAGQWPVCSRR